MQLFPRIYVHLHPTPTAKKNGKCDLMKSIHLTGEEAESQEGERLLVQWKMMEFCFYFW